MKKRNQGTGNLVRPCFSRTRTRPRPFALEAAPAASVLQVVNVRTDKEGFSRHHHSTTQIKRRNENLQNMSLIYSRLKLVTGGPARLERDSMMYAAATCSPKAGSISGFITVVVGSPIIIVIVVVVVGSPSEARPGTPSCFSSSVPYSSSSMRSVSGAISTGLLRWKRGPCCCFCLEVSLFGLPLIWTKRFVSKASRHSLKRQPDLRSWLMHWQ